ncbi:TonB-dependent receptor domain-containing protein [Asaia sp. VD9]|uniref:TonB-dependent receptor domain-containing protein n=1 Tax=Asaia sp. VD9 TaxID=3081235 RepID=UPI003017E4A0
MRFQISAITSVATRAFLLASCAIIAQTAVAQTPAAPTLQSTAKKPAKGSTKSVVPGSERPEHITVVARKSSALLQLRAKNDVSVADAAFIASHPDTNIAETLARLPGVNVLSTTVGSSIGGTASMIDNASRGEGQLISVRGIGPDYTLNLIDGVNVATAKPASRQVQLSLMPPLGFSDVVVNKTAQASEMGEWISGFVDFHTPNALELGHDAFSLKGRGDFNQQAYRYGVQRGPFNGGGVVQADATKLFGSHKQFGVRVVGYYQSRNFATQVANNNEYYWDFVHTLTGSDHTPVPSTPPTNNLIAAFINPQASFGNSLRTGGNLALDWQGEHVHAFARGSFAYSNTQQYTVQRSLQAMSTNWLPQPDGTFTVQEGGVNGSYWYETNPEIQALSTMQIGAAFDLNKWHATVAAFGSFARDDSSSVQVSYKNYQLDPSGQALILNQQFAGRPPYPVANLTAPQISEMNNFSDYVPQTSANYGYPGVETTDYKNNQALGGVKFDNMVDTGWTHAPHINFGLRYYDTIRNATNRDYSYDNPDGLLPGLAPTLASGQFQTGSISSPYLGALSRIMPFETPILSMPALKNYISGLPLSYATSGGDLPWTGNAIDSAYNANANTQRANEGLIAGYFSVPITFGAFTLEPGLRFEHSDITNRYWNAVYDTDGNLTGGAFQSDNTHYNQFLPSVFATYRPTSLSVYRASAVTSYVRPNTFLLGGGRTVTPDGNGVFTVQEGNPNLRPVVSRNFDIGGQWIAQDGSSLALTGYYKLLSDYLFDAGSSTRTDGTHYVSSDSTTNSSPSLIINKPANGGNAQAYGLEVAAEKKLRFLPSFARNLSLSGNLTLQRTHANLNLSGIANGTPIQYAPAWMFNVALSYTSARVNSNLSFRRSGKFIETYYLYKNTNIKIQTGATLISHGGISPSSASIISSSTSSPRMSRPPSQHRTY